MWFLVLFIKEPLVPESHYSFYLPLSHSSGTAGRKDVVDLDIDTQKPQFRPVGVFRPFHSLNSKLNETKSDQGNLFQQGVRLCAPPHPRHATATRNIIFIIILWRCHLLDLYRP